MSGGNIGKEIVQLVVEIENSAKNKELQNELIQLQQKTGSLKDENKRLASAMEILRAQGKKNSDEFKVLQETYDNNSKSIAENERRVKTLRATMNNTYLSAEDLRRKSLELQKELNNMSRAADTKRFDALNKELKETQKQMKAVRAGTSDTGNAFGNMGKSFTSLLGGFAKMGSVVGIAQQAISSFKESIHSTQTSGDAWDAMVKGMQYSYNAFLRTIQTGDWSNLFSNMREAYKVGKEVAEMLDELFERNNSLSLTSPITKEAIEDQYDIRNDPTKSLEERQDALKEIIRLTTELGDEQKSIAKQEMDAHQKNLDFITNMRDEEKKFYIDNYNQNKEYIREAQKLIKVYEQYNTLKDLGISKDSELMKGLQAQLDVVDRTKIAINDWDAQKLYDAFHIGLAYNIADDESIKNYADSRAKFLSVDVETRKSLRRINKQAKEFDEKRREESYANEIKAAENHKRNLLKVEAEKYQQAITTPGASKEDTEAAQKAYNDKQTELEDNLAKAKLAINIRYNKDTGALEDQLINSATKKAEKLAKATADEREKAFNDEIKALEEQNRTRIQFITNQYTAGEISQEVYNNKILELEQQLTTNKLNIYIQYGKDTKALEDKILSDSVKNYEKAQKEFEKLLGDQTKIEQDAADELQKWYDEKQSEAEKLKAELREKNIGAQMNFELAALDELHNLGLISQEEYEEKKLAIRLDAAQKFVDKVQVMNKIAGDMVGAMAEAETAKVDAEHQQQLKSLQENRDAGLITEEEYNNQKEQLDNEAAQKKLDIEKKYADVNFAIKVAEIIANTATAIMQAYAQLGPIAGSIAAAMLGTTGAMQMKAAAAERDRVKAMTLDTGGGGSNSTQQRVVLPGREDGGYVDVERQQDGKQFRARTQSKRGYVHQPTVLTGEAVSEFVANHAAVSNPTVRPVLDFIDIAQQNGTISSINMPKFLSSFYRVPGMESGGFTPSATSASDGNTYTQQNNNGNEYVAVLAELAAILKSLGSDGIKAYVVLSELQKQQDLLNKSRDLGSRATS